MFRQYFKIIVIISSLVLAVVSIVFIILKFNFINFKTITTKNQPHLSAIKPTNETADEFNKFLQAEAKKIIKNNKKLRPGKKNMIFPKTYSLQPSDCDKVKENNLHKDCLKLIEFNKIITSQDISKCDQLTGSWRDECIHIIVRKIANTSNANEIYKNCLQIKDSFIRSHCLNQLASQANQPALCNYLSQADDKEECLDRVKAINNQDGDIVNCRGIKIDEYFLMCVNMTKDSCDKLQDNYLVKKCSDMRLYGPILLYGSKKDCQSLQLKRYRETCKLYFENGKKDTDFDGDGLTNGQELFLGTNPLIFEDKIKDNFISKKNESEAIFKSSYYLAKKEIEPLLIDSDNDNLRDYEEKNIYHTDPLNPDTDGDGYADGAEVKAGYNPLGPGRLKW